MSQQQVAMGQQSTMNMNQQQVPKRGRDNNPQYEGQPPAQRFRRSGYEESENRGADAQGQSVGVSVYDPAMYRDQSQGSYGDYNSGYSNAGNYNAPAYNNSSAYHGGYNNSGGYSNQGGYQDRGSYGRQPRYGGQRESWVSSTPPGPPQHYQQQGRSQWYTVDTTPSMCLRILMDSRKAGGFIGKGGSSINELRSSTGANVNVSSSVEGASKRILTVKGPIQNVIKATHVIADRLTRETTTAGVTLEEIEIVLLIPLSSIGNIIGKGGAKIKETRDRSGIQIKVSREPLPHSTEKSAIIRGAGQGVHVALDIVLDQLSRAFNEGPVQLYEPEVMPQEAEVNEDGSAIVKQTLILTVREEMVGAIIGRGGSTIREIREQSKADIKIPGKDRETAERMLQIRGSVEATELAVSLINARMAQERSVLGLEPVPHVQPTASDPYSAPEQSTQE